MERRESAPSCVEREGGVPSCVEKGGNVLSFGWMVRSPPHLNYEVNEKASYIVALFWYQNFEDEFGKNYVTVLGWKSYFVSWLYDRQYSLDKELFFLATHRHWRMFGNKLRLDHRRSLVKVKLDHLKWPSCSSAQTVNLSKSVCVKSRILDFNTFSFLS